MAGARSKKKLRVVFDTNVLLSATLWDKSASQKVLFRLIQEETPIFLSEEILSEYLRVVRRDFEYSEAEADTLVEKIRAFAEFVIPSERVDVVKADDADNRIIECALAADATHILSYDRHLLDVKEFMGIRIVVPEKLWR